MSVLGVVVRSGLISRTGFLLAGASAPLLAAGLLYLLGSWVSAAAGALILTVVVVAVAAAGDRLAGLLAAVTAATGFDIFLTDPRLHLVIENREDIEVAVLMLLVGLAVAELAAWGHRQAARAAQEAGFVSGLLELSTRAGASAVDLDDLAREIGAEIVTVLGAERCTFSTTSPTSGAVTLLRDGTVRRAGVQIDVDREGLPTDAEILLPVTRGGTAVGCFRVSSASAPARPSPARRRAAILLADQLTRL